MLLLADCRSYAELQRPEPQLRKIPYIASATMLYYALRFEGAIISIREGDTFS